MAMIGVGDVERSRGKKMKKILLCIVLWILLITGCSNNFRGFIKQTAITFRYTN